MQDVIEFPRQYGLQYPICKTPGPWIVVGLTVWPDHVSPDHGIPGEVHSVDIHFNGDDPTHEFAKPEDYPKLPRRVIDNYNAPHKKSYRLRARRATEYTHDMFCIGVRANAAAEKMGLASGSVWQENEKLLNQL
jgi:hypothetical protein